MAQLKRSSRNGSYASRVTVWVNRRLASSTAADTSCTAAGTGLSLIHIFKHALLRDVTYESVLLRRRRDYHHRAAEWLIIAGGDRVDEYADLIAGHYAAAGEGPAEAEWQTRAGKHAAARFALPEAERAISRALVLLPAAEAVTRFELLLERESIYQLQGRREAQAADLAALAELAAKRDEPIWSAEVALRYASFYNFTGDYAAALEAAAAAEPLAAAGGDGGRQAKAHLQAGQAHRARGEYDLARADFNVAIDLARRAGARYAEAEALRAIGITAQEQGDPTALRETFELSLALARELGDRRTERRTLNSLGVMEENDGNYEAARAYFEESLALGRAIGDRTGVGTVLGLSLIHISRPRPTCKPARLGAPAANMIWLAPASTSPSTWPAASARAMWRPKRCALWALRPRSRVMPPLYARRSTYR